MSGIAHAAEWPSSKSKVLIGHVLSEKRDRQVYNRRRAKARQALAQQKKVLKE